MHDLDALVSQARSYLVDKGYARSTIAHHEAAWRRLESWCEDEGVEDFDHDVERRFVVPAGFDGAYSAYAAELEQRGLRACTREGYLCTVRNFCEGCGATRPEELDAHLGRLSKKDSMRV